MHKHPHAWLSAAIPKLQRLITQAGGTPCKVVQVHWGFCGGASVTSELGSCWDAALSSNDIIQIFISPIGGDDPVIVLATLLHELIHAATERDHGTRFRSVARGVGFKDFLHTYREGMTAELTLKLGRINSRLGRFPGGSLAQAVKHFHRHIIKLREARMILPASQAAEITKVEAQFVEDFGGFTAFPIAKGGWKAPDGSVMIEPVVALDVAMKPRDSKVIERIASDAARDAGQQEVYLRLASGEVLFVKPTRKRGGTMPKAAS